MSEELLRAAGDAVKGTVVGAGAGAVYDAHDGRFGEDAALSVC